MNNQSHTNIPNKHIALFVRIQDILSAFADRDRICITSDIQLADIIEDSLDRVELLMEIEKELHVRIEDENAEKLETVGDIVGLVSGMNYVLRDMSLGRIDEIRERRRDSKVVRQPEQIKEKPKIKINVKRLLGLGALGAALGAFVVIFDPKESGEKPVGYIEKLAFIVAAGALGSSMALEQKQNLK